MNRCLLSILFSISLLWGGGFGAAEAQNIVQLSNRTITVRGELYLLHTVRKGETLPMIAKAYAVSREEILKANSLTRETLRAKQTLLIPQHGKRPPVASVEAGKPARQPEAQRRVLQEASEAAYKQQGVRSVWKTQPQQAQPLQPFRPADDTLMARTAGDAALGEESRYGQNGRLKPIGREGILEVAVLLPIQPGGAKTNERFSAFYKGVLLGLEALKSEGVSARVRFLSSGASEAKTRSLIQAGKLDGADLIIGPVYAEAFGPVAKFAEERGVPVVSPLGTVGEERNPYVFEAAPDEAYAYRHIFEQFDGRPGSGSERANFVLIDHVEYPDSATVALIERQLGDKTATLSFTSQRSQMQEMERWLSTTLDRNAYNIVYVPVNRPDAVEGVLSHLSSININGKYKITVIGTPRWAWISNVNLDMFYKLDVHYPASYHADRGNPAVAEFYRCYMDAFDELPTPYAFRGYDVIRYFVGALDRFGSEMPQRIAGGGYRPELLQVGYDFRQVERGGKFRNTGWPVVHYKSDYTIGVD